MIAGPQSGDEKERSVLPETDILSGVPPSEPKHEHVDFMKEVREERKKEEDVMEEQRKKLEEEKKEQERIIEEQKKLEEEKRALLEKQILNLQAELELIKREKARDEQRRLISESGVPKVSLSFVRLKWHVWTSFSMKIFYYIITEINLIHRLLFLQVI